MKMNLLIIFVCSLVLLATAACRSHGCSSTYWLNPDKRCRVHDELNGNLLVEYFDQDTNELLLYLQRDGRDTLIEHPYVYGTLPPRLADFQIRFDPNDPGFLVVGSERFRIVQK